MFKKRLKENATMRSLGIMMLGFLVTIVLLALPVVAQPENCSEVLVPGITLYDIAGTIDPTTIPQFEYSLNTVFPPFGAPPVWVPTSTNPAKDTYVINVSEFDQQLLPPVEGCLMKTTVYGYGGQAKFAATNTPLGFVRNTPAGTFEAVKGRIVEVKWVNDLTGPSIVPVDPILHWADPNQICSPPVNGVCPESKDPGNVTCMLDSSGTLCMPMVACYPNCPDFPPGIALAQSPIPIVTHLHGAEVRSTSDGGPNQWFTSNGIHGPDYTTEGATSANSAIYEYPNNQLPTSLFYHDHALGMTRLNVLSGLAGFYLIRDPGKEPNLIADPKYEVQLAIQDRTFKADGDLWFPTIGNNPDIHPYWNPEFFGNTIMVNGLVWPKMDVDQTTYRLRFVDGSNARFYTMHFIDSNNNPVPFLQIGSDGGYLANPISLEEFTFAPGERVDILINFTGVTGPVTLINDAPFPFPTGDLPRTDLDGIIMRFDIGTKVVQSYEVTPSTPLNNILPDFATAIPTVTRNMVLKEDANPANDEPTEVLLNGQRWAGVLRETPAPGTIEEWRFIDTTMDTHPMHVHLVQFQVTGRQSFYRDQYLADWIAKQYNNCSAELQPCGTLDPNNPNDLDMFGQMSPPWPINYSPLDLNVSPYLFGDMRDPDPNERGWKDTIRSNPDEVTFIRIRYAKQDGTGHAPFYYSFNPTFGPGYVWHCHIIDHEDNEMMRPYKLVITNAPGPTKVKPPVPGPIK